MSSKKEKKRKFKNINPLFEQWLTEWRDKAAEERSKMQYCFGKALTSLKMFPLVLETGADCLILNGFGQTLCRMLDEKLGRHIAEHGKPTVDKLKRFSMNNLMVDSTPGQSPKKRRSLAEYIPQVGSGAYAILVTLCERGKAADYPGFLTKNEIIEFGRNLADKSFTRPDLGTRYTAWSSMKTLLERGLVVKKGSPAKFNLTPTGMELADNLLIHKQVEEFVNRDQENSIIGQFSENLSCLNHIEEPIFVPDSKAGSSSSNKNKIEHLKQKPSEELIFDGPSTSNKISNKNLNIKRSKEPILVGKSSSSVASKAKSDKKSKTVSSQSSTNFESLILAPGSFQIVLFVDTAELAGGKDNDSEPILLELDHLKVAYEVRHLKVGDYLWICRDNETKTELVLPYIIERKRIDDFAKSIKDTRYYEQKFRLKQCGCSNVIYMIESHGKREFAGLPYATLMQAATNTLLHDNFTVKFTVDIRGTAEYLASMSTFLQKIFIKKTVVSCLKQDLPEFAIADDMVWLFHFTEFCKDSNKNKRLTVKDMFVKQLLQIKGLSLDKALAIVEKYPTPSLLKEDYEIFDTNGEKMLENLPCGTARKKLGTVVSKIVYQFFTNTNY